MHAYALQPHIDTLHLDIHDDENEDILELLPRTLDWIDQGINSNSPTLLLCHAGVSRSATVATAHLMRKYSLSLEDALVRVRRCRPIAEYV